MRRSPSNSAPTLFELLNLGSPDATEWTLDALCAETDPELFHPEKGGTAAATVALAKRVCRACSVRAECLSYALDHDERDGVWGGTSPNERRALARAHKATPVSDGEAA